MLKLKHATLKRESVEKISGFDQKLLSRIPVIKSKHYRIVQGTTVGGDAPKELLRIYEYTKGKRKISNPKLWDLYIVKTGHKWYPYESITEYLLNRIGWCLKMDMSESKLAVIGGQLRFLSKYFLSQSQQILEHGAELYAGFLDDRDFVEEVEKENRSREFFTIAFTQATFHHLFPKDADRLFQAFLRMVIFDAIIGNNDRHFYNWAIIKNLEDGTRPTFAPIYDTARALFWNTSEQELIKIQSNEAEKIKFIQKYVARSKPKIGIETKLIGSHFHLIEQLLLSQFPFVKEIIHEMVTVEHKNRCHELIRDEMRYLMSRERLQVVSDCLISRFDILLKLIK